MNASSAISLFLVPLVMVVGSAVEAVSDEDDGAALKALDAHRTSSLRPSDGYLIDWDVIGPFSVREKNGIGFASIDVEDLTAVDSVEHAGREYDWSYVITKNGTAVVDLSSEFGADSQGIAYAAAEVYVNRDMIATIRVESGDEIVCWINGQTVALASAEKEDSGASTSRIRLRLGYNKVVIGLRHGQGKWSFSARVLDEAGEPIDPKRLRVLDDGRGFVPAEVHLEIRGRSDTLPELHRP